MGSQWQSTGLDARLDMAQIEAVRQHIRQMLETKKLRIIEEIHAYPSPIPACDAQFNGLLEDRGVILQELGQVQNIFTSNHSLVMQLQLLHEFAVSSRFLTTEVVAEIEQLMTRPMDVRR